MKQVNVLHLLPAESGSLFLETCAHWQDHFDPGRFRFHLAFVPFDRRVQSKKESKIPIHYLDFAGGFGALQFRKILKQLNIQMLHSHLQPAALWGIPIAKTAGIRLFAHNHGGSSFSNESDFFQKIRTSALQMAWNQIQKIAVRHQDVLGALGRDSASYVNRLFVNPLALEEHLFKNPFEHLKPTFSHFIVHAESFCPNIQKPPLALQRALVEIKKQFPQALLRFHKPTTKGPIPLQDQKTLHIHMLLIDNRITEKIYIRMLELIAAGRPFIPIIPPKTTLSLTIPFSVKTLVLHPKILSEALIPVLENPKENLFKEMQQQQGEIQRQSRVARHCDLWRFQYEEMIENSFSPKVFSLKHPGALGRPLADPFSDRELLGILKCAICNGNLSWEIEEKQNDLAWNGKLICECGQKYPVVQGMIKLYPEAWNEFEDPASQKKPKKDPIGFWQKNFEHKPLKLLSYYRNLLSSLNQNLPSKALILDLKCGSGGKMLEWVRLGAKVLGVDSGSQIEIAKEYLKNYPQARFVQIHPNHIPLKKDCFHLCFHEEATLNLKNPEHEFKNWRKFLFKDGQLHLICNEWPLIKKNKPKYYNFLRRLGRYLPFTFTAKIARFLALKQIKTGKIKKELHPLQSLWFRLMAYPKINLYSEKQLRTFAEKANLHQLQIQKLKNLGIYLIGRK